MSTDDDGSGAHDEAGAPDSQHHHHDSEPHHHGEPDDASSHDPLHRGSKRPTPDAHGHGDPFTWDPTAERARKGGWLIAAGLVLVAAGALLWWLGTT